jgi:aromatic ring-opening dioxygenase LigB subunit
MGKENIILKIIETDAEILIHFHVKDIEVITELCGARTNGKNISPFSVKNLPKDNKPKYNKYEIPQENKELYDKMIALLKEWTIKQGIRLGDAYNKFYLEFGKSIKIDFVEESKKNNYKIVHIIEQKELCKDAINWLSKKL